MNFSLQIAPILSFSLLLRSNKKLLVTSATLLGTSALLVVLLLQENQGLKEKGAEAYRSVQHKLDD